MRYREIIEGHYGKPFCNKLMVIGHFLSEQNGYSFPNYISNIIFQIEQFCIFIQVLAFVVNDAIYQSTLLLFSQT